MTSQFATTLKGLAKHVTRFSHPQEASKGLKQSLSSSAKEKSYVFKPDLVKAIAEQHELTVAKSDRIVTSVFDTILESVVQKKAVRISNFGTFDSFERKARTARNPRTGESLSIPAKESPRFKPAAGFKNAVKAAK